MVRWLDRWMEGRWVNRQMMGWVSGVNVKVRVVGGWVGRMGR